MSPSPSDPDLWYPGDCIDPRDVEDEPEPDVDEDGDGECSECGEPCVDEVCDECVERAEQAWSHPATRGDGGS